MKEGLTHSPLIGVGSNIFYGDGEETLASTKTEKYDQFLAKETFQSKYCAYVIFSTKKVLIESD
jgi:hypothetical protein